MEKNNFKYIIGTMEQCALNNYLFKYYTCIIFLRCLFFKHKSVNYYH